MKWEKEMTNISQKNLPVITVSHKDAFVFMTAAGHGVTFPQHQMEASFMETQLSEALSLASSEMSQKSPLLLPLPTAEFI